MCDVNEDKAINAKWRNRAIAGLVIPAAAFVFGTQFQGMSVVILIYAACIIGIAMAVPWLLLCATDDNWLVRYAATFSFPILLWAFLVSTAIFLTLISIPPKHW